MYSAHIVYGHDGKFFMFFIYKTYKVGRNLTQTKEIYCCGNETLLPAKLKQYRIKKDKIKIVK